MEERCSTTGARPQRRDAARNRERIIAGARSAFAERGLDASLAEIAERAGVGLGTIYRNFKDKDDLITSLLEEKLDVVTSILARAEALEPGWTAFVALLEGLTASFVADRSLEEIMLSEHGRRYARLAMEQLRPGTTRIVERARTEGALREDVAFNDLMVLLTMIKASVDVTIGAAPDGWRRYLALLVNGLRARIDNAPLDQPPLSDQALGAFSHRPRVTSTARSSPVRP